MIYLTLFLLSLFHSRLKKKKKNLSNLFSSFSSITITVFLDIRKAIYRYMFICDKAYVFFWIILLEHY